MTGHVLTKIVIKFLRIRTLCGDISDNKHLNIFNFHCEFCNHGGNEEATIKCHKDQTHGIPTDIRCENPGCNKPFPQKKTS